MSRPVGAVEAASGCPACRDAVHMQQRILVYKRVYLCDADKAVWDAADARERAAEKRSKR